MLAWFVAKEGSYIGPMWASSIGQGSNVGPMLHTRWSMSTNLSLVIIIFRLWSRFRPMRNHFMYVEYLIIDLSIGQGKLCRTCGSVRTYRNKWEVPKPHPHVGTTCSHRQSASFEISSSSFRYGADDWTPVTNLYAWLTLAQPWLAHHGLANHNQHWPMATLHCYLGMTFLSKYYFYASTT